MESLSNKLLLIILSVLVSVLGGYNNEVNQEKELMTLYIDKINVDNKIYSKESILNDIDINVIILKESDYPDMEDGTVLLGGHSGIGEKAYFQRMNEMNIGDIIRIDYKEKEYVYKIDNISKDNKDGKIRINYGDKGKRLIIYTCCPGDKDSYLVLSANQMFT